jgi:hypothetical protein
MSRRRKLSPQEEAAVMAWYSQYQAALEQLRKLGSIRKQAQERGIGIKLLHVVVKRGDYEHRRKMKSAGLRVTSDESLFARAARSSVQTPPTPHGGNDESAHTTATEVRRGIRPR